MTRSNAAELARRLFLALLFSCCGLNDKLLSVFCFGVQRQSYLTTHQGRRKTMMVLARPEI